MTTGPVAVVGAYGGAGEAAVRQLAAWGIGPLRLGGRHPGRAAALAAALNGAGAVTMGVDATDPDSLDPFCAGARVVLNCAGPAYLIGDRVAAAAARAGADYVDAAGDDHLLTRLVAAAWGRPPQWTALISAGLMPGLTGLLPRYAAAGLPAAPTRMHGYVGGRDRFTPAAAADYLAVADAFGEPLAAWRNGARVTRALSPLTDATLRFFPEPATAAPYLSTETERVARDLKLDEVRWYSVFAGRHVLAALRGPDDDRLGAAERIRRAAELDVFGQRPYQILVVELGGAAARTVVLRGTGASALTGTVAALATRAIVDNAVVPGIRHAAEALDPVAALTLLRDTPAVLDLAVYDRPADAVADDEGEL
jgi:hypothetical protein